MLKSEKTRHNLKHSHHESERVTMHVIFDKVWMYEEIMMNDNNLESNLLTASLLKCVLWYKLNYVN